MVVGQSAEALSRNRGNLESSSRCGKEQGSTGYTNVQTVEVLESARTGLPKRHASSTTCHSQARARQRFCRVTQDLAVTQAHAVPKPAIVATSTYRSLLLWYTFPPGYRLNSCASASAAAVLLRALCFPRPNYSPHMAHMFLARIRICKALYSVGRSLPGDNPGKAYGASPT